LEKGGLTYFIKTFEQAQTFVLKIPPFAKQQNVINKRKKRKEVDRIENFIEQPVQPDSRDKPGCRLTGRWAAKTKVVSLLSKA